MINGNIFHKSNMIQYYNRIPININYNMTTSKEINKITHVKMLAQNEYTVRGD